MSFHDVRFPAALSFGSVGGPERRTDIVTLSNGFEERNSPWSQSRRRFDAGVGVRDLDDLAELIVFFEARQGRLHAFRWKDWTDWTSGAPSSDVTPLDQMVGTGDGTTTDFQLVKRYTSGGTSAVREIRKPVSGTVRLAVDGTEVAEGSDWTLDDQTGVVSFAVAPGTGATVTTGFEFDVPVRFDTDRLDITADAFDAGAVPDVPVVEVRL